MSATADLHRFIHDRRSTLPRPIGGLVGEYRNTSAERAETYDQLDYMQTMGLVQISGGHITNITPPPEKQ